MHRWIAIPLASYLAASTPIGGFDFPAQAEPSQGNRPAQPEHAPLGLKVRRLANSVEVVVLGTGASPQLQQSRRGDGWQGVLTTMERKGVFIGAKQFSLPEAGIRSVSLDGGGTQFQLDIAPASGIPLAKPVVSADGQNLIVSFPLPSQVVSTTARPDLNRPGTVPAPVFAPPLQPRAVAPPLGDMAIGSMVLRNQSYVSVSGPKVTLTLRNAPAKDALMSIAQLGGYGFVYISESGQMNSGSNVSAQPTAGDTAGARVTLSFRNESYARALNSVLLAAGLQGKKEGNLIVAGPAVLGKSFGPQMSKVYRLNQASSSSAADYLASLGATISKVNVITATSASSDTAGTASSSASNTSSLTESITNVETYGASVGPLKGLSGTTDSRLQTITLIGDAALVAVAENYLRQLDLRQRQVALTVRILDVNLNNDSTLRNSFAFRWGNNLVLSDDGQLVSWVNSLGAGPGSQKPENIPQDANFANYFVAYLESSNTKVLASPTLILSENPEPIRGGQEVAAASGEGGSSSATATIGRPFSNESFVTVGNQVITNYDFQPSTPTQGAVCKAELSTAGLTFGARVSRIDDNGFVTFSLSPQISAVVDSIEGANSCGRIDILSVRRLDTGTVRVRDGQTLILTGVISDEDIQQVTKWPVLGDIPIIGQFFRGSRGSRRKSELVIMVTPRIVQDSDSYAGGYGYRPGLNESRRMVSGGI